MEHFIEVAGLVGFLLIFFIGGCVFMLLYGAKISDRLHNTDLYIEEIKNSEEKLRNFSKLRNKSDIALKYLIGYYSSHNKLDEMQETAELFIKRFPKDLGGYLVYSQALRRLGKFDQAQLVINKVQRRFSKYSEFWSEQIFIAREKGEMQRALHIAHNMRLKFPDELIGWTEEIQILIADKEYMEAERALSQAIKRFPFDVLILRFYAQIAENRNEWELAANHWARFRKHHDTLVEGYINGYDALKKSGKINEANSLIKTAKVIFYRDASVAQRLE